MAAKKGNNGEKIWPIPPETIIDLVCIKGEKVVVTPMRYDVALNQPVAPGWVKHYYQKGYHGYTTTPKKETENKNNGYTGTY